MEIKQGDVFIYKSKYGGITKGVVSGFHIRYAIDYHLKVILKEPYIISTTGVPYDLCEVSIVAQKLEPDKNVRVQFAELVCKTFPPGVI